MLSSFSQNLRFLRESLNLKQDFLAKKLGISRSVLSYYESGKSEPTLSNLIKISNFFNISLDKLISEKLSMPEKLDLSSNFDIDYFSIEKFKKELIDTREYYLNEKEKLYKISTIKIPKKIEEIDSLLEYISNQETNIINSEEEFGDEITPDLSFVKKHDTREKVDEVKFRSIPCFNPIAAGNPSYALEDIVGFVDIPESKLNSFKEYFSIPIKGDSMNKLYNDCEQLLVEKINVAEPNDLVIALVTPVSNEATFKKFRRKDNKVCLTPMSTNPIHKVQIYNAEDVKILGKVLGKIDDFLK